MKNRCFTFWITSRLTKASKKQSESFSCEQKASERANTMIRAERQFARANCNSKNRLGRSAVHSKLFKRAVAKRFLSLSLSYTDTHTLARLVSSTCATLAHSQPPWLPMVRRGCRSVSVMSATSSSWSSTGVSRVCGTDDPICGVHAMRPISVFSVAWTVRQMLARLRSLCRAWKRRSRTCEAVTIRSWRRSEQIPNIHLRFPGLHRCTAFSHSSWTRYLTCIDGFASCTLT